MMPYVMLVLIALPCFGMTAQVSRSLVNNGQQSETEELEETVHCCSQRRVASRRLPRAVIWLDANLNLSRPPVPTMLRCKSMSGHRMANWLLAPMLC